MHRRGRPKLTFNTTSPCYLLAKRAGFCWPPEPYRPFRRRVRGLFVAPALSPLLEGNTADFGFAPAGTNALLAKFVEGGLITVSRRRECEAELKQMQDVDELWTICVRMPPPGWRLIGRFMDKDCFAFCTRSIERSSKLRWGQQHSRRLWKVGTRRFLVSSHDVQPNSAITLRDSTMTSTTKTPEAPDVPNTRADGVRQFDREMLRSDFLGIFWAAIQKRRRDERFTMQMLANALGRDKTTVSRWFDGTPKNWETDTISDIASALDLEFMLKARDRKTGTVFTPSGVEVEISTPDTGPSPRTATIDQNGRTGAVAAQVA